jgi:hypothetical protein
MQLTIDDRTYTIELSESAPASLEVKSSDAILLARAILEDAANPTPKPTAEI